MTNLVNLKQSELEALAEERPQQTAEIFKPNEFYGRGHALKTYLGVDAAYQLPGVMSHSPALWRNLFWDEERDHFYPFRLSVSTHQKETMEGYCPKKSWVIGSPFYYAKRILENEDVPNPQGTLVMPAHSTHHVTNAYDKAQFIKTLKDLPDEYKPLTICLFFRNIQLGDHLDYLNAGFQCTTAGHMFDPEFLFRLVRLIKHHKRCVLNSAGTGAIFCAASSVPVLYIKQEITPEAGYEGVDKKLIEPYKDHAKNIETKSEQVYAKNYGEFIKACLSGDPKDWPAQKHHAEVLLGKDDLLTRDEMASLFEKMWTMDELAYFRNFRSCIISVNPPEKYMEDTGTSYTSYMVLPPERIKPGEEMAAKGELDKAMVFFQDLVKQFPRSFECYNNIGVIHHLHGRMEEALKCFKKSFSLNATDPDTVLNLGDLLTAQGEEKEALEAYRSCLMQQSGQ